MITLKGKEGEKHLFSKFKAINIFQGNFIDAKCVRVEAHVPYAPLPLLSYFPYTHVTN
jgi:hypothetical protein